jgi:hypothetical protein
LEGFLKKTKAQLNRNSRESKSSDNTSEKESAKKPTPIPVKNEQSRGRHPEEIYDTPPESPTSTNKRTMPEPTIPRKKDEKTT